MKMAEVAPHLLARAQGGELLALETLLISIQPAVFNLALRMLGNREDAQDATQEILLKITTHLSSFRGDSAFGTWAYRVASNALLTARTRSQESPEMSLEALQEKLGAGMDLVEKYSNGTAYTPEDKLAARRVALGCTQSMLMALDREQRIAYLLDVVFGLPSEAAAQVLEIGAEAYRKRLSRARQRLDEFMGGTCGLVAEHARCTCGEQVQALKIIAQQGAPVTGAKVFRLEVQSNELASVEREFGDLLRMADAAAVFRAHPQYSAPGHLIPAIRAVLTAYEGRPRRLT
jgi:RNA polymerase sigma factor (sigma-70 family)